MASGVFIIFLLFFLFFLVLIGGMIALIVGVVKGHNKKKGALKETLERMELPSHVWTKVNKRIAKAQVKIETEEIIREFGKMECSMALNSEGAMSAEQTLTFKKGESKMVFYSYSLDNAKIDYTAFTLKEGLLECFRAGSKLTVKLQGAIIGTVDYNNGEVKGVNGEAGGYLRVPSPAPKSTIEIEGVGSYDLDYNYTLFLNGRAAANILPSRSNLDKLREYLASINSESRTAIGLFSEVAPLNEWEAELALAIGVDIYRLNRDCTSLRATSKNQGGSGILEDLIDL